MIRMRHCIITPELSPFIKNGGVGTNALHLSEFLHERRGVEVVILVTSELPGEVRENPAFLQRVNHARVVFLEDIPFTHETSRVHPKSLAVSLKVDWWLREQNMAVVHGMQYLAPTFSALRRKRLGLDYASVAFVTILNSPQRWLAEHGRRMPDGSASGLILDHMERYCVAQADHVCAPTEHLLEWMRDDGWKFPASTWHLPTYNPPPAKFKQAPEDRSHFVFFGRLETRKGLELFVQAIQILAEDRKYQSEPLRFTFLGKIAKAGGVSSETFLRRELACLPEAWEWEIISHYDQPMAMDYLERHSGSLFVMPSQGDNSPNTILECLARGLRILCSDAPGVSELFQDNECLVPLTPHEWASRLAGAIEGGVPMAKPAISFEQTVTKKLRFLDQVEADRLSGKVSQIIPPEPPMISIIVPHFNAGPWLPQALRSLADQTYKNFEVVVVDDGSTCESSQFISKALEKGIADARFRFFRQRHQGACATRNFGVSQSWGEYLLFFDADNIAFPGMLEIMFGCLYRAQLDVVTCDLYSFESENGHDFPEVDLYWAFAGGPLEAALKMNCLGDSNMLVRREVFASVGGFYSAQEEASADRALLVRFLKAGYRLDCIPEPLFCYRRRPESMSRKADQFQRAQTVMAAFTEGLDPWLARILESNFPVYATRSNGGGSHSSDEFARLTAKVDELKEKLREERSKRRERDRRVDYLYAKLTEWRYNPFVRFARFIGSIPRQY